MRSTSTSLEQSQIQDGHTDEVKKNSFTLLPTTSSPRCHSSVPKTSLACDFSTGRMWEYLSEQPASLAVQQRHWQTNDFFLTKFSMLRCAARLGEWWPWGRKSLKKQQLGLLEGNKNMQFLLNALQAPSAKKDGGQK